MDYPPRTNVGPGSVGKWCTVRKRHIVIFAGGSDCAGLSPAVKSVGNAALDQRHQWRADTSYEMFGNHERLE